MSAQKGVIPSSVSELRTLSLNELSLMAGEIRRFLGEMNAGHPGHLASSLGVTELSIALHYVFDTPNDKLIWDVGHQAYVHKLLTSRKNSFKTLRKLQGISGFPSRSESEFDAFGTGHSSTALSAALGLAMAAALKGDVEQDHIAVVGDGAITGGMFFEALNHAGNLTPNVLLILNDNGKSIDPTVGVLHDYLENQKRSAEKDNLLFQIFGMQCYSPVDGNDLNALIPVLANLKRQKGLRFLHLITSRTEPESPISTEKGLYQDVFGETMVNLATENSKIVAISAAMLTGTSLNLMKKHFPDRTFDVGIAEQHAVTFSAGLAAGGFRPYCAIYASFFQRAYDQFIHDVALQKLPVVFCLDRAGLVGEDGATHHGVFDLASLRSIPDTVIAAPMDEEELSSLLYSAQFHTSGPYVIRYPKGKTEYPYHTSVFKRIETGTARLLREGDHLIVISFGRTGNEVELALNQLAKLGIKASHLDLRFLKPLDENLLHDLFRKDLPVITVEDAAIKGGMGSSINEFAQENGYFNRIKNLGIPDHFVTHGTVSELRYLCGIDAKGIEKAAVEFLDQKP